MLTKITSLDGRELCNNAPVCIDKVKCGFNIDSTIVTGNDCSAKKKKQFIF